jgi:hypothetical protein
MKRLQKRGQGQSVDLIIGELLFRLTVQTIAVDRWLWDGAINNFNRRAK